ncbi:MAG: acyl-CoA desaturase [Parvibaculum sp.]|nr:acyl-CoA desaturase [Parvibaculum sp.]
MTAKIRFVSAKDDPFLATLRTRVNHYLSQPNVRLRGRHAMTAKCLFLGFAAISFYIGLLSSDSSAIMALFFTVAFGLSALMLALNLGHDGAHDSVARASSVNQLLQAATFTLLGVDAYLWRLRHARSHHIFPNVNGCDIDIDENPFFRLSPNQPVRWYFRYQAIYAPAMYCLVALHTIWWQDFVYLRKKELANLRDIRHGWARGAQFFLCKAIYLALAIVIPLYVLPLPWWQIALNYLIANAVVSLAFVFLLIGTHFSMEAEFPVPAEDGQLPFTWAEHVLRTSVDWNASSPLTTFWMGGINAHAAHHLFPRLSHVYYSKIASIIEQTAREFGLPYHSTGLLRIIRSHFQFLRRMGASSATI